MNILLLLLLLLFVVVLVGHGLWEFVAWIVRGSRPRHGARYEPTVSDDRAATARHLEYLRSHNLLDPETQKRLMRILAEDAHSVPHWMATRRDDFNAAIAKPQQPEAPSPAAPAPDTIQDIAPTPLPATPPLPRGPADADRPEVTPPPQPKPEQREPRRMFSQILVEFMAEKNIRWGELIGGLLILCCSTALVISLWSQIESIPILKFVIFTTVTAALFGVGLFVHRRWKLPMTGHAILVISSLLVPLNFLAFAAFSESTPSLSGWTITIELPTIVLFGWLTFLASRIVMANAPVLFAGGIMGLSICSLLIQFVSPSTDVGLVSVSVLPVCLYAVCMAAFLWGQSHVEWTGDQDARQSMLQLGVQTFACVIPLGLVAYASGRATEVIRLCSPLLCAMAAPALVTGIFVSRRLADRGSAQMRTTATSITLVAIAVLLLGVGLAWPMPARLMSAFLINALVMIVLIRMIRHPAVHGALVGWLAAAWILGVHLISGSISWSSADPRLLMGTLLSARTGQAMVAAVAVCLFAAHRFERQPRYDLQWAYGIAALTLSMISLALITWFGFGRMGDPQHVAWVYLVYGVAAFGIAGRMKTTIAGWTGCILIQLAIAQMLVYIWPVPSFAWPTALLTGASLCAAGTVIHRLTGSREDITARYVGPACMFAIFASLLGAFWMTTQCPPDSLGAFSIRIAWLSGVWIVLSITRREPIVFAGSQMAMLAAASTGAQHYLHHLAWYQALPSPWLEPELWQIHLCVAGGLCLVWASLRALIRRIHAVVCSKSNRDNSQTGPRDGWHGVMLKLLNPTFLATDRWLAGMVLVALLALSTWSVLPEIIAEHGCTFFVAHHPYQHAGDIGSWILAAIVAATFVLHLREGFHQSAILALTVMATCVTALLASAFDARDLTTSAWRWLSVSVFGILSLAFWTRSYWIGAVKHVTHPDPVQQAISSARVRLYLFLFLALPAVLLTMTFAIAAAVDGITVAPNITNAWLRFSLIGPMAILAISLIGYGVSETTPGYVIAAATLSCAAVTGTELCILGRSARSISPAFVVWLVQLNTLVFAAIPVFWRSAQNWTSEWNQPLKYPRWPLITGRCAIGAMLLVAAASVWLEPQMIPTLVIAAGAVWSLMAIILVELTLAIVCQAPEQAKRGHRETIWLLLGVPLLGCMVSPLDTGNWICFHVLLLGFTAAGWLRLYLGHREMRSLHGGGWQETLDAASTRAGPSVDQIEYDLTCAKCHYNLRGLSTLSRCPECGSAVSASLDTAAHKLTAQWTGQLVEARTHSALAVTTCIILSMVFALRGAINDPGRPWWSACVLAGLSALCIALAAWIPRRTFAYLGGMIGCLAASIWWTTLYWGGQSFVEWDLSNFANVNLIALIAVGMLWLWVEQRFAQPQSAMATSRRWPAFHHAVAVLSVFTVAVLAGTDLLGSTGEQPVNSMALLNWLAWGAAVALVIACTIDPSSRDLSAGLYVLGLAGVIRAITHLRMVPRELTWAISLTCGAYVLTTTLAWWRRSRSDRNTLEPFAIGPWLLYANSGLGVVSILLATFVSITHPEMAKRMLIVIAPLLCGGAAWLAVGISRRSIIETCTIALPAVAGILFVWSWIAPDIPLATLHRIVGLVSITTVLTVLSAIVQTRTTPKPRWVTAIIRCVIGTNAVAIAAILCFGATEAVMLIRGETILLANIAVAAMIVALAMMIVSCILFATSNRIDPLSLTPRAKEIYVYIAEALAGLLILHLRATMPWLFANIIAPYWPMLIIVLAFAAAGAKEACERYGQRTLSRPLGHTGIFLPALILPELFMASSQVHYSAVLLAAGVFYAVLAFLRRSLTMSLLAGVSINGSLWYLLYHTQGLGITRHPQLWLIPPALAVLVAGYLNRDRLNDKQQRAIHYACLLTIYISSTADVFLIGVARAPWLPLVLAGLSIVGIFAGLASRVRSFLLLGTGFLCLSLFTMTWHAATNLGWTWIWYVAGIVIGIAIIAVFALFEKKRHEMKSWLEQFRAWND